MRFLSAMIMLSLLLISACGGATTQTNRIGPVTSADNLRTRHDLVTGKPVFNLIPMAEMDKRGREELERSLAAYQVLGWRQITDPSDPRLSRLLRITRQVQRYSHLRDRQIDIALIETPVFQAYTFGGGAIIYYTGLVNALNDDQLAVVAGHELAHIAAGHVAEDNSRAVVNTARQIQRPSLTGFYAIGAEIEADQIGIVYATLAGFDPMASVDFWREQARRSHQPLSNPFTDTHPSFRDRTAYLEANIAKLDQLSKTVSEAEKVRLITCNPVYCFRR